MKIVAASSLAAHSGTKLLVYGPPGTGKTPISGTAPRPILLSAESGRRSMYALDHLPCVQADTAEQCTEFMRWATTSAEAKKYDTFCIDSISQIAEHYLLKAEKKTTHGMQAYGFMLEDTKLFFDSFNRMPEKNIYFIAKLSYREVASTAKRVPYFPGKALETYIPHEVDECYYASRQIVPGGPLTPVLCWQTFETPDTHCRSRNAHIVSPYEPCDLTALFSKIEKGSRK